MLSGNKTKAMVWGPMFTLQLQVLVIAERVEGVYIWGGGGGGGGAVVKRIIIVILPDNL